MKILITGTAGFIGFHLAKRLLERSDTVVGIDNINDYYDVNLKYSRLAETGISREAENWHTPVQSTKYPGYKFVRMNLEDKEQMMNLFEQEKFDKVCNLAAQAGVRYSLENPHAYINSNIVGFMNILEACRHNNIKHLAYASSSSVYGSNTKMPLSTSDNVDNPISLYAATKKSNELMAHTYSHLFGLPTTGLRFFTVYGPWGRPDMALFLFTKAILEDKPIKVFNNGNMVRDFTYVDDIIEGVVRVIDSPPQSHPERTSADQSVSSRRMNESELEARVPDSVRLGFDSSSTDGENKDDSRTNPDENREELATKGPHSESSSAPYKNVDISNDKKNTTEEELHNTSTYKPSALRSSPYAIYNIGNSSPVPLMEYISAIESTLGKTAKKEFLPMQPGDVPCTEADVTDLVEDLGYKPDTPVQKGIEWFIEWYKEYFKSED